MTDQAKPEPAIDPREVARLARELYIHDNDLGEQEAIVNAETYLRIQGRYLAEHKIPSAEDPRDAEIRVLNINLGILESNQRVALDEMKKLREQADHWCRRALAAESKPAYAPKLAEPTRTERLVRFALDLRALGCSPFVGLGGRFLIESDWPELDAAEAAAVRAALEEGADG